ncbi:MAG: hypothetical protein KGJ44_11130 [Betaproteobacteria bacterium]|nr:hypothetical protein [Betaproteobacteria bacterium]
MHTLQQHPEPAIPRPIRALGTLLLVALLSVAAVRLTGHAQSSVVPSPVVAARQLQFFDRSDGGITVVDASNGSTVSVLPPASNGFLRGTLRSLVRERREMGKGAAAPFALAAHADGRLVLTDTATGRSLDLEAFGASNAGAFAALLRPATKGDTR